MKKLFFNKNFLIIFLADLVLVAISWYASYLIRFNFVITEDILAYITRDLPSVLLIKITAFHFFHLYRGMFRYASLDDLIRIIGASTVSTVVIALVIQFSHGFLGFPRSIFVLDWLLTMLLISGCRFSVRLVLVGFNENSPLWSIVSSKRRPNAKNLLIIGAGDFGEKIYREIRDNAALTYNVVGFIDDDPEKIGRQIHGKPIMGPIQEIGPISARLKAKEALIAISSMSAQRMRNIISLCESHGIAYKTLPSMGELIGGKVTLKAIREVTYRDLLGREVISLEHDRIGSYIQGQTVLVTGAGGSIGSELCRQICRFKPERLILFEQAESPLYESELELKTNFPYVKIIPILGNIRNADQVQCVVGDYRPQVIFHAAAYKHVPMLEAHPWEAVITNIIGTKNVVQAARMHQVRRFVLVSTDKAVRPTNVMGTTKRVAELIVQGQNCEEDAATRFITVRFGNVIGSVGSVVPLFKKQIARGGPVTVTHPDVIRYFMTIPEACQLILQAGAMGNGGEIFILDMGTPIRIVDMARDLIRLYGLEPDVDIKVEFIGLRPGEKLYEELITEGENVVPTGHEKIMVLRGQSCDQMTLAEYIEKLEQQARNHDAEGIRKLLKQVVPEYQPNNHISGKQ